MAKVQSATQMTFLRLTQAQVALTVRSPTETVSVNLASQTCLVSRAELRQGRITEVMHSRTSPTENSSVASKTTKTTKTNRKRAKRSSNKLRMATTMAKQALTMAQMLKILSLSSLATSEAGKSQCYQSDTFVSKCLNRMIQGGLQTLALLIASLSTLQ